MPFAFFDSHCHLHFPQFDADRDAVLARMRDAGAGAVLIGTDFATSVAAANLAQQHDFLFAAVGLHPNETPAASFDAEAFEQLARAQKVVAIGECGLDYFRSGASDEEKKMQRARFLAHVDLAERVDKPLIIHCREAHDDMLELLAARTPKVSVVIHFFTGSGELAARYLDQGCYLSFPGPITYGAMYDDAIRLCPLDRLLIETDAPFAAPVPYRGSRNEPLYVTQVGEKIARIKELEPAQILKASTNNAIKVFKYGEAR